MKSKKSRKNINNNFNELDIHNENLVNDSGIFKKIWDKLWLVFCYSVLGIFVLYLISIMPALFALILTVVLICLAILFVEYLGRKF